MFFPDPPAAVTQMARVLRPGGIVALSAWGPPAANAWAAMVAGIVSKILNLSPSPPDAPGIFRFAGPGALAALRRGAGLAGIRQEAVSGEMAYDSPEIYWEMVTEVTAPIAMALRQVDATLHEQVRLAVLEAARAYARDGRVEFPSSAWVAAGVK